MELGPLTVVQQGKYVSIQADVEHPDYEEFRRATREMGDALPERLLALREQLTDAAAPYHAFEVVFAVWGTYGRVRPSTLQPLAGDALTATAEFVAHVMLDRPNAEPTRAPTPEEIRGGPHPYELGGLVAEIVSFLPIHFAHRQLGEDGELDPWLDLRARLYMHRLAIRSFTYVEQETETLKELFGPFDSALRSAIGFGVEDALALARGAGELPMMRASERAGVARDEAEKLTAALEARRRGKAVNSEYSDEILGWLQSLPPRHAEQSIVALTASWAWHGYGRDAAFTVDALADHVGVAADVAASFLRAFSVGFGEREDLDRWRDDPKRAVGGEMEVMRKRPVLHDGHGNYLPFALDSLFYGLRDTLTDALKKDPKVWERFQAHRAHVIEERALNALARAFGAQWAHGSVKYQLVDENGEQQEGEADGILRADTLAVLVETKAGALAPSARRTAPNRLEKGLRELVEAADAQLRRDRQALAEGKATSITDQSGKALTLDLDGVVRVVSIVVTLEDLSGVAPATWRLQDAGLLPPEEQAPWVVGIHELELICDLVERPAQLLHYISRRARANRQRIWAMDEMDFFMRYLQEGLFWQDDELEEAFLELHNHTDALDEWWFGERGFRKPAPKPRQRMNAATRQLLDDIEATGMTGRIEAQVMVLDMAKPERERVASGLRRTLRRTQRDGQPHDETLVFQDDFAVTLHAIPQDLASEAADRLANHGIARTEKSKLRRWLGLSVVDGTKRRLTNMALIVRPDRLAEDEPDKRTAEAQPEPRLGE